MKEKGNLSGSGRDVEQHSVSKERLKEQSCCFQLAGEKEKEANELMQRTGNDFWCLKWVRAKLDLPEPEAPIQKAASKHPAKRNNNRV